MTNRRDFLKITGAAALGSMVTPSFLTASCKGSKLAGVGIQTFTINNFMGTDVAAAFKKLADIGFKNIETATYTDDKYYGMRPKELKVIIDDLGMKWIGHHAMGVPITKLFALPDNPTPEQQAQYDMMMQYAQMMKAPNLTDNLQKLVDDAAEGGLEYLICASTAVSTIDNIKEAIGTFSKAGEACKKAELQFAFHNHATEWVPIEGTTSYDMILSQTDKHLVKLELDLGWVATAKKDPVELFKGNPGRFPLFHVKDFDLASNMIVPVGKGNIDFGPAFANAKLAGMKYYFYEQDTAQSFEDVASSYSSIIKMLEG
ncbi:MAG: sugar phosphate isomerase/epimerase [Bacteroidia bacterium]|nr:sugar phosphate isomerase/epimerase [Bacteroidia bacterium]